uniref:Uncharacterized protein n=1 Tax=Tanacetum cinerariifolium TaxID=118510 RepID=A0A6L2K981_TANCI|nr:hypothetical protein [Tanacetum cinerariifolium]
MQIKESKSNEREMHTQGGTIDRGEALDASLISTSKANDNNDEEAIDARLVSKAYADDSNEAVSNNDSVIVDKKKLKSMKILENKLDSMKILKNKLESMTILHNKLKSLKLQENQPIDGLRGRLLYREEEDQEGNNSSEIETLPLFPIHGGSQHDFFGVKASNLSSDHSLRENHREEEDQEGNISLEIETLPLFHIHGVSQHDFFGVKASDLSSDHNVGGYYTARMVGPHMDITTDFPGKMQHPVDGRAWKDFDTKYLNFAVEPRNVRLGLAADGFNPFGNLSQSYSMWPVILTTYNLPSWLCVETIDVATGLQFNIRVMVLWTINGFLLELVCLGRVAKVTGSFGLLSVIRIDHQELKKVIWYVLHNSPEIDTYQAMFKSEFSNKDMKEEFPGCESNELFALACGPSQTPILVNSCVINGVTFVVHSRDERRTTQNNDICLPGPDEEMYYDGQSIDVDAPPDIIDVVDENDDIIDEEYPIPLDLADEEDLVNLDIDDGVNVVYDVECIRRIRFFTGNENADPADMGAAEVRDELRSSREWISVENYFARCDRSATLSIYMESSATREYPSLIHTFFLTHTVGGVFVNPEDKALYDEMLWVHGLGSNTPSLESQPEYGGGSGSGRCGDDEDDGKDGEDEDDSYEMLGKNGNETGLGRGGHPPSPNLISKPRPDPQWGSYRSAPLGRDAPANPL